MELRYGQTTLKHDSHLSPSATLERPEHFFAKTRTLQCFTSKLGHRGHVRLRRQNHKGVCGKSQRDRHERCQPHAAPTALTNRSEKPVFGQGLNSAVLHFPSKTLSFIILDPSRRSNLGPLDLEKKSTSRRFFQIGPRTKGFFTTFGFEAFKFVWLFSNGCNP